MMDFELNTEKVEEILGDYELDHASPAQRSIIAETVATLHEYTAIPANTLMGFVYISILSWENENKVQIKMLDNMSPETRQAAVDKMRDNLKFMLRGVLVKPDQWKKLENGIDKAYMSYQMRWNQR